MRSARRCSCTLICDSAAFTCSSYVWIVLYPHPANTVSPMTQQRLSALTAVSFLIMGGVGGRTRRCTPAPPDPRPEGSPRTRVAPRERPPGAAARVSLSSCSNWRRTCSRSTAIPRHGFRPRPSHPLCSLLEDPRGAQDALEARPEDRAHRLDWHLDRAASPLRGVGEPEVGESDERRAAGRDCGLTAAMSPLSSRNPRASPP